jgi:hypothetical protein
MPATTGRNIVLEVSKLQPRNPSPFVVRGALGGAVVGLFTIVESAIKYQLTLGYIPYAHLFIIPGIPMALGFGALAGRSDWCLNLGCER